MPNAVYYYETEDGTIHQHVVNISEIFLVSILFRIGKGETESSVYDLPKDIKTFYFPSGRIWHANGNSFTAQNTIKYKEMMLNFKRIDGIRESKEKKNG